MEAFRQGFRGNKSRSVSKNRQRRAWITALTDSNATRVEERLSWILGRGKPGLVSVIVPAYNRERLLPEALESVRRQTYRPIELIVVDDGSIDNTARVAAKWFEQLPPDRRFTVRLITKENGGAAEARNTGTEASKGAFIQYLDSDDLLSPSKIECQVRALERFSVSSFAYGPIATIREPDRIVYCQNEMTHRRMLLKQFTVPAFQTMGPLLSREVVEKVGRWNSTLEPCDDWEYYSRLVALSDSGVFVRAAVSYYRDHTGARLSRNSPVEHIVRGRFGQINSLLKYSPNSYRNDPEFVRTAAWQIVISAARFVTDGWNSDESVRYRQALDMSPQSGAGLSALFALKTRSVIGRQAAARLVLVLPWLYYRIVGFQGRVSSGVRFVHSAIRGIVRQAKQQVVKNS